MIKFVKLLCALAMSPVLALSAANAEPSGDELAEKMIAAFGSRDVWASREVDHITAVVEPSGGEAFLIELFTRWDKPQTVSWVRTRTREQLRVWDGLQEKGWSLTREYAGGEATVKEWSAERAAIEAQNYKTQFERLIHRVAKRDPDLQFGIVKEGPYQGWLEVSVDGEVVNQVLLREDGSPEKVTTPGVLDVPIEFDPLVSFGDHKQPGSGFGGAKFTTYVAKLLPNADSINFGLPKDLSNLDPTR